MRITVGGLDISCSGVLAAHTVVRIYVQTWAPFGKQWSQIIKAAAHVKHLILIDAYVPLCVFHIVLIV